MVEECSCEALEWSRLLELVASLRPLPRSSRVAAGHEAVAGHHPGSTSSTSLVAEMRLLLAQGMSPALGGLFDPTKLTDKARIQGASLEPEEIRDLLFLVDNITSWQGVDRAASRSPRRAA